MKAVRPVIASYGIPYLKMMSVRWSSTHFLQFCISDNCSIEHVIIEKNCLLYGWSHTRCDMQVSHSKTCSSLLHWWFLWLYEKSICKMTFIFCSIIPTSGWLRLFLFLTSLWFSWIPCARSLISSHPWTVSSVCKDFKTDSILSWARK